MCKFLRWCVSGLDLRLTFPKYFAAPFMALYIPENPEFGEKSGFFPKRIPRSGPPGLEQFMIAIL